MILADKITEERKKNGWSQEELADRLGVSRQAVSKWESAGSVPDLQRVLQLAELFGVSTDYLLKDELLPAAPVPADADRADADPVRRVSMEEANEFLAHKRKNAPIVANAVAMCILSPVLFIILGTMEEDGVFHVTKSMTAALGCVFLFGMIAAAVYLFITCGIRSSRMEHLEKEAFETAYGVSGMVKERRAEFESTFARGLAIGVVLCVVAVVPLVVAASTGVPDYVVGLFTALMFVLIAAGVDLIVRVCIVKGGFDALLQEGGFSREEKRAEAKAGGISGIFWLSATACYLGWSFWTMRWDHTWIVWPVAGVLFGVVKAVAKTSAARRQ